MFKIGFYIYITYLLAIYTLQIYIFRLNIHLLCAWIRGRMVELAVGSSLSDELWWLDQRWYFAKTLSPSLGLTWKPAFFVEILGHFLRVTTTAKAMTSGDFCVFFKQASCFADMMRFWFQGLCKLKLEHAKFFPPGIWKLLIGSMSYPWPPWALRGYGNMTWDMEFCNFFNRTFP